MASTLLLVTHGSRVPEAADEAERLRALVEAEHDGPVLLGHLELSAPLAMDVVDELDPEEVGSLVVQPLLLLPGNHAKFDVTAVARRAIERGIEVRLGQPLGSDVRLLDVAGAHLSRALPADALLVIASGTASDAAIRSLDTSAALVASGAGITTVAAAPATLDGVAAAEELTRLGEEGNGRVVVLPWMLFPGRLEAETGKALLARATELDLDVAIAARFGAEDGVAQAVLHRVRAAKPFVAA